MAKRTAHVTILREDRQHTAFVSRLLKLLGYEPRRFRFNPAATNASQNKLCVLRQYVTEVRELRSSHLASRWLVVMLDVDDQTVEQCRQALDDALRQDHEEVRHERDQIVLLLPRRNIETWIAWLLGDPVNEVDAYAKLRQDERACAPAVKRLVDLVRSGIDPPAGCPPSLLASLGELRRFARSG